MDSIFKLGKFGPCGVKVIGLELDNDEYLSEDNVIISTRNYTYNQSVTINILKSVNYQQEEVLQTFQVLSHQYDCLDESEMIMKVDGLHTIIHMILPTQDWLSNILLHAPEALEAYYGVYYYDTVNDQFMKFVDGYAEKTSLEEILEINAIPPLTVDELTTTIIRSEQNTFQLCHLMDCFYKIYKNLLKAYPVKCPDKTDELKQLQYYRDIIWMGINTIKYLLERGQYFEAQRILEELTYCGSICNNIDNVKKVNSGCGCSKN